MNTRINSLLDKNLISENIITDVGKCNLHTYFEVKKGLPSSSASDSDLYLLEFKRDKSRTLFMKVFRIDHDNDRANMERIYYEYVTDMYFAHKLRNILPVVVTSGSCSFRTLAQLMLTSMPNKRDEDVIEQLARNLYMMGDKSGRPAIEEPITQNQKLMISQNETEIVTGRYGFIITLQVQNNSADREFIPNYKIPMVTYSDYLRTFNTGYTYTTGPLQHTLVIQFKQYLFQLIFTLAVFERMRFKHNDLHMNNILMDQYYPGESKLTSYTWYSIKRNAKFNGLTFTDYIPRIFDFDRSTTRDNPNVQLVGFEYGGQISKFTIKTDFMKLICGVYTECTNEDIRIWIIKLASVDKSDAARVNLRAIIDASSRCLFTDNTGWNSLLNKEDELNKLINSPLDTLDYMVTDLLSFSDGTITKEIMEEGLADYQRLPFNHMEI